MFRSPPLLVATFLALDVTFSHAQVLNFDITVPAPTPVAYQWWVDVNPGLAGVQRCHAFAPAADIVCNHPFPKSADLAVDVRLFNVPAFPPLVGAHFTVHFDPTKLAFVGVQAPALFGGDSFPLSVPLGPGKVRVVTSVDPCGPGVGGTGVIAQLCFASIEEGQSGIDLTDIALYGRPTPCVVEPLTSDASEAKAQVIMDLSGTRACWTINTDEDGVDIAVGDGITDSDPALGIVRSTLRACIQESNARAGADGIAFRIEARPTVKVGSSGAGALPALTDDEGVYIDGTTQDDVLLNGEAAGADADGFRLDSNKNTIRAVGIVKFRGNGVRIADASLNTVTGCRIGTDAAFTDGLGNRGAGVSLEGDAAQNLIGAQFDFTAPDYDCDWSAALEAESNVIVRNDIGVKIQGRSNTIVAHGNVVAGNYIGVTRDDRLLGNRRQGVYLEDASANRIFANTVGDNHMIHTPAGGIGAAEIYGRAVANVIECNFIGVTRAGTRAPNDGDGVRLQGVSPFDSPIQTRIGGLSHAGPSRGNEIHHNLGNGIAVRGVAEETRIQANDVRDHTLAGILLTTLDGGDARLWYTAIETNTVQRNLAGLWFLGAGVRLASVTDNEVRENSTHGVLVRHSRDIYIGAFGEDAPGNVITKNGSAGVALLEDDTTDVFVIGNRIFDNTGLGIDIDVNGVTKNDREDRDGGPNGRLNFPVLTIVKVEGGTTILRGTLHAKKNESFNIGFCWSTTCDPSGNGEGENPFYNQTLGTDFAGDAMFDYTLPFAIPVGASVTAITYTPSGSTSEFSECRVVQ